MLQATELFNKHIKRSIKMRAQNEARRIHKSNFIHVMDHLRMRARDQESGTLKKKLNSVKTTVYNDVIVKI